MNHRYHVIITYTDYNLERKFYAFNWEVESPIVAIERSIVQMDVDDVAIDIICTQFN